MKPFYHRIGRKSSPLSPSYSQESSVFLFLRWSWPKLVESERWLQQGEGGDHFEETSWQGGGGGVMWWRCFDIHFLRKSWLFISNNGTNVIYFVVFGYGQIRQFGDGTKDDNMTNTKKVNALWAHSKQAQLLHQSFPTYLSEERTSEQIPSADALRAEDRLATATKRPQKKQKCTHGIFACCDEQIPRLFTKMNDWQELSPIALVQKHV